jgi:hypothetical protein
VALPAICPNEKLAATVAAAVNTKSKFCFIGKSLGIGIQSEVV